MPSSLGNQVVLDIPVKGIDQGAPANAQPSGTCPDALNVRALQGAAGKEIVGKRPGHSKAFTTQIGGSISPKRINALFGFDNTPQEAIGSDGAPEEVEIDIPTLSVGSSDMGSGWLNVARIGETLFGGAVSNRAVVTAAGGGFSQAIQVSLVAAASANGVIAQKKSTNTVSATFQVLPQADGTGGAPATGAGLDGPATDGFTRCAVFNRINYLGNEAIAVYFRYGGSSNTVRLYVSSFSSGVNTDVYTGGSTYTLSGSATPVSLTITVTEISSTQLRVQVSAPGALSGPADLVIDETIAVAVLNDPDNQRSGAGLYRANTGVTRRITSLSVTAIDQSTGTTVRQVDRSDSNPIGVLQFFIPEGVTSVKNSPIGTITSDAGAAENATASNIEGVYVDDNNNVILNNVDNTAATAGMLVETDNPAARRIPAVQVGAQVLRADPSFVFYTRVNPAFSAYVKVDVTGSRDSATRQINVSAVQIRVVSNNVAITTTNVFSGAASPPFRYDDVIALLDDGVDGISRFRLTVNGTTFYEWTVPSSDINSTVAAGLYDTDGISWRRCGAAPERNAANGEIHRILWLEGGLLPEGGLSSSQTSFGMATTYVAAYVDTEVHAGNLQALTLSKCSGTGMTTSVRTQAAALGRKLYSVNGSESKIVDPINLTVTSWTATKGTLPQGCKLVCTYRGRIVLANQDSNPGIYYMSRILDPLDWDFGAAPEATTAIAGTNADFGQPGSGITCLVPYSDDYLFFGCGSSIWMMEGDPGYGGQVQNLSYQTGFAGPRAYTFDSVGNLWFLGQDGLYVIRRGSLIPENVSGRRLAVYLDNLNFDTNLIQMAYNTVRGEVMILVQPNDGQVGTSVCYDTAKNAFWLDQYNVNLGPWAAMNTTGVKEIDRSYILGGNDGYIRRPDEDVNNDDGTIYNCRIRFAPIEAEDGIGETRITELHGELTTDSAATVWEMYVNESATQVNSMSLGSPVNTGNWASGFQTPIRLRQRAPAHQLVITQSSLSFTFGVERVSVWIGAVGRRR